MRLAERGHPAHDCGIPGRHHAHSTSRCLAGTGSRGGAALTPASSAPWGWLVAGVILLAAIVIGFVVWKRARDGARTWSARSDDLTRRLLVSLDAVLAKGSMVTDQVEALAAEARALEEKAPDERGGAAAGRLRARLDDLAAVLEADRSLRLASPPPSQEQVAYSAAIIRERVEQLQAMLRPTLVTR